MVRHIDLKISVSVDVMMKHLKHIGCLALVLALFVAPGSLKAQPIPGGLVVQQAGTTISLNTTTLNITSGATVTSCGIATACVAITGGGGGGVTSFNTRTGTVTLESSDVTTALGYTPAHSGANSDITSLTGLTTSLSVAQGGTGTTTSTGTGNVVLSQSPTFSGTPTVNSLNVAHSAISSTVATISSGFGTGDAISRTNASLAWRDVVGTSPGTSAVFTMAGASDGWDCGAYDQTTPAIVIAQTSQTATSVQFTSYSRTTGTATAPSPGDDIEIGPCIGH